SGLFWSLALRLRTILSASGPFSIAWVAHMVSILLNVRTCARRVRTFFVLADLLYVMCGPPSLARGPFSFIGTPSGPFWSLTLRVRTILSASGPFSIACVAHVVSILSNVRTSARRVRTFFVLADLLYVMGGPLSVARGPFHYSGPQVDFSGHSCFARRPFSV